jgi:predicted Na+-dependent transporter
LINNKPDQGINTTGWGYSGVNTTNFKKKFNEKFYKQYIYCGQSQVVPNVVRVVLVPVVFGQSSQSIKRNIERKKGLFSKWWDMSMQLLAIGHILAIFTRKSTI